MSAEAVATAPIIALDRPHQTNVAFLNQVKQREATPDIALGNADH